MTTLEQQIAVAKGAFSRSVMRATIAKRGGDDELHQLLTAEAEAHADAAETLRAMQWRYDMENAPHPDQTPTFLVAMHGVHGWTPAWWQDGEIYAMVNDYDPVSVWPSSNPSHPDQSCVAYAWMHQPTPAPLPQGESE